MLPNSIAITITTDLYKVNVAGCGFRGACCGVRGVSWGVLVYSCRQPADRCPTRKTETTDSAFVVVLVLVLRPRKKSDLEDEHENEDEDE